MAKAKGKTTQKGRSKAGHKGGRKSPAASQQRTIAWGGVASGRQRRRDWMIAGAVLAVLAGLGAWWGYQRVAFSLSFDRAVERGQAALERVETPPDMGRGHVAGTVSFAEPFPTSGDHSPRAVLPGVYETRPAMGMLVHALEHGNVVIYADQPGEEAMRRLRRWAEAFDNAWAGVVLVMQPGLGARVVLTAWGRRLELASFERDAAAAFIDAYRGRGPERPAG